MEELLSAFGALNISSFDPSNERELFDRYKFQQAYSPNGDALKASLFHTNDDESTVFYNYQVITKTPGDGEDLMMPV